MKKRGRAGDGRAAAGKCAQAQEGQVGSHTQNINIYINFISYMSYAL